MRHPRSSPASRYVHAPFFLPFLLPISLAHWSLSHSYAMILNANRRKGIRSRPYVDVDFQHPQLVHLLLPTDQDEMEDRDRKGSVSF
jgi:hypothetical protein